MTNIYMLLLMSSSGTMMYLLSRIFAKKMKRYIWQYAMLITAVIMLLVPIQKILEIPKLVKLTVPQSVSIGGAYTVQTAMPVSAENIIMAVWLAFAVIFAVRILLKYIKSSLTLKQITEECYQSNILDTYFNVCSRLSVRGHITLRVSKHINSPLLFGLVRPSVIIPDREFSQGELEMILAHELTHYKHGDLWISLAASIAGCVHWFNPAVYFMGKSITEVRELFCDEAVLKELKPEDKKAYGRLILSVIEKELNSRLAYTTSMAAAGDSIQKRLRKIVEFKMPTRASAIAGIMAVFACVVSSLTAFGFETVTEVMPEEIKQVIPISAPTREPLPKSITPQPEKSTEQHEPKSKPIYPETKVQPRSDTAYSGAYTDYAEAEFIEETPKNESTEYSPDIPENSEVEENTVSDSPMTSYIFNADFGENTEIQSEVFSAESGTTLSISKVNGSKDVQISVHDAATGEIIYDEREDKTHDQFLMSLPENGEYYVKAYSEDGGSSGIYIYGE